MDEHTDSPRAPCWPWACALGRLLGHSDLGLPPSPRLALLLPQVPFAKFPPPHSGKWRHEGQVPGTSLKILKEKGPGEKVRGEGDEPETGERKLCRRP